MKFDQDFKDAIARLPSKEKDKLLLRLLKKDTEKQKYKIRNDKPNCNQIDPKFYCFNFGHCKTKKIVDEWKTFCICKKVLNKYF